MYINPEVLVFCVYSYKKLITKLLRNTRTFYNRFGLDILIYKHPTSYNIKIFAAILFESPSIGTIQFFKRACTHIFFINWMNKLELYSATFLTRAEWPIGRKYIF